MSKQDVVEELHKPARKNFQRRHVILKGINDLWQADLIEMVPFSKINKGFRYILTIINGFTKYAYAIPISRKTCINVTEAFETILKKNTPPKHLQTDKGSEFYGADFKKLMKKYKITHYSTLSPLKATIIERWNRTLKERLWKKFSLRGSYKYYDILQEVVQDYNNTIHRTIKMKPVDVKKKHEASLLSSVYNYSTEKPLKSKLKMMDPVRVSKFKCIFDKSYYPSWSTEIFQIRKVQPTDPVTYLLRDSDGKDIAGCFYFEELQKTKFPDVYLVERILKRKGDSVYVKWLGMNSRSWIKKSDIL